MRKIFFYVFFNGMDKISFTGFKNLSYAKDIYGNASHNCVVQRFLNVELTNDSAGQDLSKLRCLINKYKTERNIDLTNPLNPNFVNIFYFNAKELGKKAFSINGIVLPKNRITLPIYDFISNLTDRIAKTPVDMIPLEDMYIKSKEAPYALLIKEHISTHIDDVINTSCQDFHNPENAKKGAMIINKGIHASMMKYFNFSEEKVLR